MAKSKSSSAKKNSASRSITDASLDLDFSKLPVADTRTASKIKDEIGMLSVKGRPVAAEAAGVLLRKKVTPLRPGKERWKIKTGTDPDAKLVNVNHHVPTTVEELVAMPRPHDMTPPTHSFSGYDESRVRGVETTVWTITAEIIAHKEEDDGDFHLVVQGDGTRDVSGQTMIVEAPFADPKGQFVAPNSLFLKNIRRVRTAVQKKLNPQHGLIKKARVRARITGIGFFDRVHGQVGVAHTNGIELHPVLNIEWL